MDNQITRDINVHGSDKNIVDILRDFEGQFVLLEPNGNFYSEMRCRCTSAHVDIFSTKDAAEQEAGKMPRRDLSSWELNQDFYDSYSGLREDSMKKYKPLR